MEENYETNTVDDKTEQVVKVVPSLDQSEMKESAQIQKSLWIREQILRQREQEDRLLDQIQQEQLLLQDIDEEINANIMHSREGRRYRDEIQAQVERRVYEMHDLSGDKLEGMKEYRNAYHRGFSLAMFLLALAVSVLAGYLNGVRSEISLVMVAFTAAQAAVLVHNGDGVLVWRILCRIVNLILFPVMLLLFITYEIQNPLYELMASYSVYGLVVILTLSTIAYFLYDPYKEAKGRVGDARSTLRSLEKQARKEVKKNQRVRAKEEAHLDKLQKKADARAQQIRQKEAEKEVRFQERSEARIQRRQTMEEKKERFIARFHRKPKEESMEEPMEPLESRVADAEADQRLKSDAASEASEASEAAKVAEVVEAAERPNSQNSQDARDNAIIPEEISEAPDKQE